MLLTSEQERDKLTFVDLNNITYITEQDLKTKSLKNLLSNPSIRKSIKEVSDRHIIARRFSSGFIKHLEDFANLNQNPSSESYQVIPVDNPLIKILKKKQSLQKNRSKGSQPIFWGFRFF